MCRTSRSVIGNLKTAIVRRQCPLSDKANPTSSKKSLPKPFDRDHGCMHREQKVTTRG